jgi:beta-glucanase (GH16 family)
LSDEFDAARLDLAKWDNDVGSWGNWTWSPDNAYVRDGSLRIRTRCEQHKRGGRTLFFKSGIAQTRRKVRYGYFEARIQAASITQGLVAPAFWLTGRSGQAWTEIDIVELIETGNPRVIKTNTHIFCHPDLHEGAPGVRLNEQKGRPELHEQHPVTVGFDPRGGFHVYACLWTKESIAWFIDGRRVRTRANDYWHSDQETILSMGLRGELRRNANDPPSEGFPAEFLCDYVRVWRPVGPGDEDDTPH